MSWMNTLVLRQAIMTQLMADSAVTALVTTVVDFVPPDVQFPYVVIGDAKSTDVSTTSSALQDVRLMLHVFSRARGKRESEQITGALANSLHNATLTVSGQRLVNLRCVTSEFAQESDGLTYHAILTLRAVLEEV